MSNKENNENNTTKNLNNSSADYTRAKFSQQIYKSGSVDNIHDLKEESVNEKAKEVYWNEVEKDSHYEDVQTISC